MSVSESVSEAGATCPLVSEASAGAPGYLYYDISNIMNLINLIFFNFKARW